MKELIFKDSREYLQFEFEVRKARRPAYSMRAFARDLHISPSSLNDFMKGRIGMSNARVQQIADALKWSPLRTQHFSDLISSKFENDKSVRAASMSRAKSRLRESAASHSLDAFKLISEWYYLVILEMCNLQDHLQASQVSRNLKLSLATVNSAFRLLQKLGLLQEGPKGPKPVEESNFFDSDIPSESIRAGHAQMLNLAQAALETVSMNQRQSHSLVFSMNEGEVSKMHDEITKAVMNIVNRYALSSELNTIRILTLHEFPIWQKNNEPEQGKDSL